MREQVLRVREFWVTDFAARVTHVHRLDDAWQGTTPTRFDAELVPTLVPHVRLRLVESGV